MTISVLIAALSLVLVGLLFGFNIQVSNSVLSIFSSISSLVAAISAAAAAYFSYATIDQWKQQAEHSLLYEHLSDLEDLLLQFIQNVQDKAFDKEYKGVMDVLAIPASAAKDIRVDYEKSYNKIRELISDGQLNELGKIELARLLTALHKPICDLKSSSHRAHVFIENNKETETKSIEDFPELVKEMQLHMSYMLEVNVICDDAISTLRQLRGSL